MLRAVLTPTRFVHLLFALLFSAGPAFAQSPNCSSANPNDGSDDSDAIQDCLDNNTNHAVYLEPGSPGYIIGDRLWIFSSGTVLSSVGGKARLKAGSGLIRPILETDGASSYTISEIVFDGNRSNRDTGYCDDAPFPGFYGTNVRLTGDDWVFHHVDTINAMCGSGLEATGDGFEIYSVVAADNGANSSFQWADGMTLLRCDGGYVHDNDLHDNTDVDLVLFKGNSCTVRYNAIQNTNSYAFAGLQVGSCGGTCSTSLSGSLTKDNTIYATQDKMGFGLIVGNHPWNTGATVTDAGEVSYNTIEGAMANLVIDGISAGTVNNNSMSSAQGTTSLTCSYTANYTAADAGSATIQGSYTSRNFHPGC